jgi:DNA polymerase III subunit alpha, Gram-positive type
MVNGITDDMVKDAPKIEEVFPRFLDFIGSSVLIAHNSSFDMSFFCAKLRELKIPAGDNYILDSLTLSRKLYPQHREHSLSVLRRRFNVNLENEHRALSDVIATCKIIDIFLKDLKSKGKTCFKDILDYHGKKIKVSDKMKR